MSMEHVATELDRIFVETLVNDPADAFTAVRLETLAHGAKSMLRIADFSPPRLSAAAARDVAPRAQR